MHKIVIQDLLGIITKLTDNDLVITDNDEIRDLIIRCNTSCKRIYSYETHIFTVVLEMLEPTVIILRGNNSEINNYINKNGVSGEVYMIE
jgi:hypothetical protein